MIGAANSQDKPILVDELSTLLAGVHRFNPKTLAFVGGRAREFPSMALYDPVDCEVMDAIRSNVDRLHSDEGTRTVVLSAKNPTAESAEIYIYDQSYFVIGDHVNEETGEMRFEEPVFNGSVLKFEFSNHGQYIAEICVDCRDDPDAVLRLSEPRRFRGLKGCMPHAEWYSPIRDRLTFLFTVQKEHSYYLALSFQCEARKPAFKWAKFTRLGNDEVREGQ